MQCSVRDIAVYMTAYGLDVNRNGAAWILDYAYFYAEG
jgi:hypothetical protein